MAKPGSTYKGGVFSGLGTVHQGSHAGPLRRIDQIPRVRGERRAMPLLTSMTVGQGSDKSAERVWGDVGHDRREPRANAKHEATVQT